MKKLINSALVSCALLFASVSPSYAATIYSNEFTSTYTGFWTFFGSCSPTSSGLSCGSGAQGVYTTNFNTVKCLYGDFTAEGNYTEFTGTPELHLWENANESSLGIGGIFYIGNSENFKLGNYPNSIIDSGVAPPSIGRHTYGMCKNGDVYTTYVNGTEVQSETFTDLNPNQIGFNLPYATVLTNFYATDTLPDPNNQPPVISTISGALIHPGDTYTANSSFTDSDSTTWHATVDYGDGTGMQPLILNSDKTFSLNHTYTTNGNYTVKVKVVDDPGASGTKTTTVNVVNQLTAVNPATVWVKTNLPALVLKLDLKAEIYKDSTFVTSGQVNSVEQGTTATAQTIPLASFSPVDFPTGSQLKVVVYARNACTGSLVNSGTATLSYNNSIVDSKFDATIDGTDTTYHLLDGFVLGTPAGSSTKTVSVAAGAKCSPFKSFGTWTITL